MKKHFLQTDFTSAVKLKPSELKEIQKWLSWASPVIESLIKKKKMIPAGQKIKSLHVSVLLCGEAKIKKLNHDYREKDYVTDVLSFPSYDNLRNKSQPIELVNGELFIGDLAICHQRTKKQAKEFSIGYMDEFIHLFFHGVIHLLGFDHEISKKEELLMEEWEKSALDQFSKIKKKGG